MVPGSPPGNTLPAFARSLEIGVSSLECDVHVSADGVPVLSHERTYAGRVIALHTAAELAPVTRLIDVIELLHERRADDVRLNVETKFDVIHPDEGAPRERFVAVGPRGAARHRHGRSVLPPELRLDRAADGPREEPDIMLSAVTKSDDLELHQPGASPWLGGLDIDDFHGSVPAAVSTLGFDMICPSHTIVTPAMVAEAHEADLRVVPYTVDARGDDATADRVRRRRADHRPPRRAAFGAGRAGHAAAAFLPRDSLTGDES